MRLLFISEGEGSLANLNPNMIEAFRGLEQEGRNFRFLTIPPFGRRRLEGVIRAFRPDVALVMRGFAVPGSFVRRLRSLGIPAGIWLVDDPYHLTDSLKIAQPYNFLITQEASCVPFYRRRGKACYFLPLAVNPAAYRPIPVGTGYRSDVCFIGNAFPGRLQVIDQLAPFLIQKRLVLVGQWWERLKTHSRLRPYILAQKIPPSEVVRYYNGAKIVLNIHRTCNDIGKNPFHLSAFSPNNRTFDIAACRSFQLATHRRDLGRFYREGEEMISYTTAADLRQKIQHYLDHGQERESIAAKAYQRTLRDHTYPVRVRRLIGILDHHLSVMRAAKAKSRGRLRKRRK